jgi:hypothetical protein
MKMDTLTKTVLDMPNGVRSILMVCDGVLKGSEVRRMVADCRSQQTIPSMTQRILAENEKSAALAGN